MLRDTDLKIMSFSMILIPAVDFPVWDGALENVAQ